MANTDAQSQISGEGALGLFGLWDWWNETFTADQRTRVLEEYNPFFSDSAASPLTNGYPSFGSARYFLSSTAMWFNNPSGFEIALKFMDKAQSYPISSLSLIRYHFDCMERIRFYYRWRSELDGALQSAIEACKEQIGIAEDVARQFLLEDNYVPSHTGYEQLAIIYEKQKDYQSAIDVCEIGRSQGWANDFEKRLSRLRKKIAAI